jgi:hypothetical protein
MHWGCWTAPVGNGGRRNSTESKALLGEVWRTAFSLSHLLVSLLQIQELKPWSSPGGSNHWLDHENSNLINGFLVDGNCGRWGLIRGTGSLGFAYRGVSDPRLYLFLSLVLLPSQWEVRSYLCHASTAMLPLSWYSTSPQAQSNGASQPLTETVSKTNGSSLTVFISGISS